MVYIDVMVVHDPLDFNLLLEEDYVYAMQDFVSTLFRVMCFPHNGNIVTIDHISFIFPHMMCNDPFLITMNNLINKPKHWLNYN